MHKLVDGVRVPLTDSEILERKLEEERYLKEMKAKSYMHDRRAGYGSYADQLDLIFHEGIEAWKEHIQSVKDAYPKPEDSK